MKNFSILILFFFAGFLPAIGQLTDNFADGNFTANPAWTGDAGDYIINASGKLQLNGPAATDTSYLSTANTLMNNAEWQLDLKMDFQPSTSNLLRVFLTANNQNLTIADGYVLKIGETGAIDGLIFSKRVGGVETQLIKMIDGQMADTPNIRVKIIRDNIGNWSFFVKNYKTGGDFVSVGNVTDNSLTSTTHFGIACYYSSTRKDKFFFDDFSITSSGPVLDITPPKIVSITALSNNSVDVLFDEDIAESFAETKTNYTVSNSIGNPNSAILDNLNRKLVHLVFTNLFPSGQLLTLTANNIQDLSSNIGNNLQGTFSFGTLPSPNFRSVVINELYPDPDVLSGIPPKEFIELFNATSNPINIANWKIEDPSSSRVLPAFNLASGAYVILCSSADTSSFSSLVSKIGVGTLPSLNNTSDVIFLKDGSNVIIDTVSYALSWYNDGTKDDGGYTLEQINPFASCSGKFNWSASNNLNGGTPGTQNSIYNNTPDTKPPFATGISVIGLNQVQVSFSETIQDDGFLRSQFSIDNGITVSSATVQGANVLLNILPVLDSSIVYRLILDAIKDCPGNPSVKDTLFFAIGKSANFNDVVITEIMSDPDPMVLLPNVEFVEIYNRKNYPINLSNWTFGDASDDEIIPNTFLNPSEYAILTKDTNALKFAPFGRVIGMPSFPSISNDGELLTLKDGEEKLVFSINFEDSWFANTLKQDGGWTLEMVDTDNPCGEANNWKASTNNSGGTPGQKNSVEDENNDNIKPTIADLWVIDSSTIKLFFTEIIDFSILNTYSFNVDNGMGQIVSFGLDANEPKNLTLNLPIKMVGNVLYTLTILGLKDCAGNTIETNSTIKFGLPQQVEIGDLIINEVLFNPRTNGFDFVEIYNKSDKIFTSRDLLIAEEDVITGETTDFVDLRSTGKLILPKDYMVMTENPEVVINEYLSKGPMNFLKVSGMPNYLDDEGVVVVRRNIDLVALDSFAFDNAWHFKLLDDEDGVSLERISFDAPTQLQSNWHSAAQSYGFATPSYLNSSTLNLNLEEEFVVEPEIFSPNQDGFEDFTTINYTVDEIGYLANVTIYDIRGRLIRRLVKNETIGQNGFFTWDGIDENGLKADVGIYIISAEFFNSEGKVKKLKGKCVLATKFD